MPEALDRAFLLFNQSRLDLAEREVRRALADSPDDPMAHALLSFCRSAAKDNDGATTEAIQAVAHGPALPFARYALANAHFRADRPAEALDGGLARGGEAGGRQQHALRGPGRPGRRDDEADLLVVQPVVGVHGGHYAGPLGGVAADRQDGWAGAGQGRADRVVERPSGDGLDGQQRAHQK